MKILVVHNAYRSSSPSGENNAVVMHVDLLKHAGYQVETLIASSDSIDQMSKVERAGVAAGHLYNRTGVELFKRTLSQFDPDLIHLHNTSPLFSPWVIRTARERGTPVVQTVHNFRHSCINGLQYRDGRRCTDCTLKNRSVPGILHGCYQESRAKSVPVALAQVFHRNTWQDVDRYIVLTEFMAERLTQFGLSRARMDVRPSWVPDPGSSTGSPGDGFLYVGRLDDSKGVRLLLDSWRTVDAQLTIVGDGPLRSLVETAATSRRNVTFDGALDSADVSARMSRARALVVPSLCFEGYPLVIGEAFAHGRPVLTVKGGSAEHIVKSKLGWVTAPDPGEIASLVSRISGHEAEAKGEAARRHFESKLSWRAALDDYRSIYRSLVPYD